jgi:hypothetical protein
MYLQALSGWRDGRMWTIVLIIIVLAVIAVLAFALMSSA